MPDTLYSYFFTLPMIEIIAAVIVFFIFFTLYAIVTGFVYCIHMLMAHINYYYNVPFTLKEVKQKGFRNANEYFIYVRDKLTYGIKNYERHIYISDDELRKMLIICLQIFPDNGTIFEVEEKVVTDLTPHGNDFCHALHWSNHTNPKAEIIDGQIILSSDDDNNKWKKIII